MKFVLKKGASGLLMDIVIVQKVTRVPWEIFSMQSGTDCT